ncbi:hypothetical protein GLOIN_2v583658 [Rhizophagus clarus]|uniref:Uncharacterized protein n=1 Tax=Rhizophagus clarus TaxID=94130 RepID=A0A8H3QHB7_9GLOM|nr:hypothetical protein GLOIN_2v583658 [Rhizophagus clarus]
MYSETISSKWTLHLINRRYFQRGKTQITLANFKVSHPKEHICNIYDIKKVDQRKVKLWKVNVGTEKIKNNNISTGDDITHKLEGRKMEEYELFNAHFKVELADHSKIEMGNIHIIAIIPTIAVSITGPSQQGVPLGPNWNDPSSIYGWIQQFTLNRNRIRSRFLDEIEGLLRRSADDSDKEDIRRAFNNSVVINTTYGNGSPADPLDIIIGAQTINNKVIINAQVSLAIRILFEYFRPQPSIGKFDFSSFRSLCNGISLSTALRVVYYDIIKQ